jgi:hypothetical protein
MFPDINNKKNQALIRCIEEYPQQPYPNTEKSDALKRIESGVDYHERQTFAQDSCYLIARGDCVDM